MKTLLLACVSFLPYAWLGCSKDVAPGGERSERSSVAWEAQHSVIADADRATVWAYHSDVDNWVRFEGDAVESITLDGLFQTGTSGTTKMPDQEPTHWQLVEVDPPRRTVIEMALGDAVFRTVWTFDTVPGGRTRLTQHMMLEGLGADTLAAFMEEFFGKTMGVGMERIAADIGQYAANR